MNSRACCSNIVQWTGQLQVNLEFIACWERLGNVPISFPNSVDRWGVERTRSQERRLLICPSSPSFLRIQSLSPLSSAASHNHHTKIRQREPPPRTLVMAAASSNSPMSSLASMPPVGFGTFMVGRDHIAEALRSAVAAGYRRIDCAPVYFNEDAIGDALADILNAARDSNGNRLVERKDLYVVSKLPSPFHRNVEAAVRKTLTDLRLDYLDLYLVHWPVAFQPLPIDPTKRGWDNEDIDDSDDGRNIDATVSIHETWKGMEAVLAKGLVRNIGVSNFPVILLHELLSRAKIPPLVNQCEAHPYLQNTKLVQYCKSRGVQFQAYSPLGTPGYKEGDEPSILEDPVLQKIAAQHDASPSQICLAWALQRGTSVVCKSTSPEHQRSNLDAQHIALSDDEMKQIGQLERGYRFFRPEEWWGERVLAVFD